MENEVLSQAKSYISKILPEIEDLVNTNGIDRL